MAIPLQNTVDSLLKKLSNGEYEKKREIATLWEEFSEGIPGESQILKIENNILFIKIRDSFLAQELKLRVQRRFVDRFYKQFGEKLKDIRFIVT